MMTRFFHISIAVCDRYPVATLKTHPVADVRIAGYQRLQTVHGLLEMTTTD